MPAAGVLAAAGAVPLQQYRSPAKQGQPIYELRQYQVGQVAVLRGSMLAGQHESAAQRLSTCRRCLE